MLELLWRKRKWLLIGLLLALAYFIEAVRQKDEDEYTWLDHAIVKVTAPVQSALSLLGDWVVETWDVYVQNKNAAKENAALRDEVYDLRRRMRSIDEIRRENHRLLGLLGLADRSSDVQYKPARVIANSTSQQFRSIRIDVGQAEGVQRGMGVLAEAGLVGRVMGVETHYSDVMLLSDAASTIDVMVGRSRARGRLRGLGEANRFRARIDYLVRTAAVEVGDEVLTTGAGTVFPKGVLAGYIQSVSKVEHGLYQEAIVEPPVSLFGLDEVLVIIALGPEAYVAPPESPTPPPPAGPLLEDPNAVPEFDPDTIEQELLGPPGASGDRGQEPIPDEPNEP